MSVTIWHNPNCSKSRRSLALLEENNIAPEVRLYLENGPDAAEIETVLQKLGCGPREIIRSNEAEYKENNLDNADDKSLIAAMVKTPKLIERPIVICGDRAAIGRPPENILEVI